MRGRYVLLIGLVVSLSLPLTENASAQPRPQKKIVEYVWCYSERMNWWLPPEKAGPNGALPPGVEAALISARQKYEAGRPLGFDMPR